MTQERVTMFGPFQTVCNYGVLTNACRDCKFLFIWNENMQWKLPSPDHARGKHLLYDFTDGITWSKTSMIIYSMFSYLCWVFLDLIYWDNFKSWIRPFSQAQVTFIWCLEIKSSQFLVDVIGRRPWMCWYIILNSYSRDPSSLWEVMIPAGAIPSTKSEPKKIYIHSVSFPSNSQPPEASFPFKNWECCV